MSRTWVVALVIANAAVLAWWQGWLSPLVDPPGTSEREPLRAARQLRPEAVRATPSRTPPGRPGNGPGGQSTP